MFTWKTLARPALLAVFTALLAACGNWSVARVEHILPQRDVVPAISQRPLQAIVCPFEDERVPLFVGNELYKIPLVGLATMFIGTRHPYPEVTKASISSPALGSRAFVGGDFTRAIPSALSAELAREGVFRSVRFVDGFDETIDLRQYDYILRGHLISTDLLVRNYDYGLNFLNTIDFSFLPKILGLPDESYRAELIWQLEMVDRRSGEVVLNRRYSWGPAKVTSGYYYGHQVEGLPAHAGLYRKLLRENLAQAVTEITAALDRGK